MGSVFVLAISAWYLLRGRNVEVARRSMAVAASFGLACSLSVVVLGDESGYLDSENQKMKIAAIEAEWHTEKPPASFTLFGLPDGEGHKTVAQVEIPWVLGLIATRSVDTPVAGIFELVERSRQRIISGAQAYAALKVLRAVPAPPAARSDSVAAATAIVAPASPALDDAQQQFAEHQADLGYGMLLLRYTEDPAHATPQQIDEAAWLTVPNVPVLFWSFRVMVAIGLFLIALFATAFYLASRHRFEQHPWFLRIAFWSLPLPWVAVEVGWIVAEYGRQPWVVDGVLPTFLAVSRTPAANVWMSLVGFVVFYTSLAVVDVFLIVRAIRRGPDGLGYWPTRKPQAAAAPLAGPEPVL